MGIFSFYKSPKPRGFHYNYMYRDPRKEALEEKVQKAKRALEGKQEASSASIKESIKGSFHQASNHLNGMGPTAEAQNKRSSQTWTLLLILAILLAIAWYFYFR